MMFDLEAQTLEQEIALLQRGTIDGLPLATLHFAIMHGNGNVILVLDEALSQLPRQYVSSRFARALCEQVQSVRVDGISFVRLVDGKVKMTFFDRDGTAEPMCGNGLRCSTQYAYDRGYIASQDQILTDDGRKPVAIEAGIVRVSLSHGRELARVADDRYFVFTSVAHLVILCDAIDTIDVTAVGRRYRYDAALCVALGHPEGLHVNFVQPAGDALLVRTYEVGVEDETLSCGTGVAAAAYIANRVLAWPFPVAVATRGGMMAVDEDQSGLLISGLVEYIFVAGAEQR